jgi:integrase
MVRLPTATLSVRVYRGEPFWEAFWRYRDTDGRLRPVKRRIGQAWLTRASDTGSWTPRSGKIPDGHFSEHQAAAAARDLVQAHAAETDGRVRAEVERRKNGASFAEVAERYLAWLCEVRGAKPSTLLDHGYLLAPSGHVMSALGDRPAAKITTAEVEALLESIAAKGVKPRTVNKARQTLRAVFYFGAKPSTFALTHNPVVHTDRRREPDRAPLVYYSPAEIEALARALEHGLHRGRGRAVASDAVRRQRRQENEQDAELVRVAAYTGLRLGELLALRWIDVDFAGQKLVVQRAVSANEETTTKSGKVRRVPLSDQAARALNRLSRREHFTTDDDLVFVNAIGRRLDRWSLRKRYERARDAAGLRPLRLHDLRHTYGSLLAAAGIDLVSIQAAMGHSSITTTSLYLHARPASEQAAAFSRAFEMDSTAELVEA